MNLSFFAHVVQAFWIFLRKLRDSVWKKSVLEIFVSSDIVDSIKAVFQGELSV